RDGDGAAAPVRRRVRGRARHRRGRVARLAGGALPGTVVCVSDPERVRIDKWLWAARFFKTRALAIEAVKGGRVQVDGARVKPSRTVRVGDRIEITIGQTRRTVDVRALSDRRGPASVAATLYEETPESRAARE